MHIQLLDHIRPLVPSALKRPMRQLLDSWETSRRSRALQRAVAALRREVQAGAISPSLWPELREAWSNTAFSADAGYLAEIAARALSRRGPVLECGSGLSTLVLGVIADARQAGVWSLEQDGEWLHLVSGVLTQFAVRRVALWHTPLVLHAGYAWFDLAGRDLPRAFLHVFCDGPAVLSHWPAPIHLGWRRGVVPELLRLGIGFDEIVLDDADDARCDALCRCWNGLGVATRVIQTDSGPFVVGRRGSDSAT